jgi:hypothetical protein
MLAAGPAHLRQYSYLERLCEGGQELSPDRPFTSPTNLCSADDVDAVKEGEWALW